VRGRQCTFCAWPATEAHHVSRKAGGGGTGLKSCDLLTAPLCGKCHRELHKRGTVGALSPDEAKAELWKSIALSLREYHLQEAG
jgi:hypothetical protein